MARVLVVDDEKTIVLVLQELLTEEGYEVITACDGVEALSVMRRGPMPDAVVLDLVMPRMNGSDLLRTMRLDNDLKEIPVVVITGSALVGTECPPKESYQGILSKPFDLDDVLGKIQTLIATR